MPAPRTSISSSFFRLVFFLSALSLLFLGWLFLDHNILHFEADVEDLRREYLAARQQEIKSQAEAMAKTILTRCSARKQNMREALQKHTQEAWIMAGALYDHNIGYRSKSEVAAMLRETLRPMRHHDGRCSFFILDTNGTLVLSADQPELEGENLARLLDLDGQPIPRDVLEAIHGHGEGFHEYLWARPGSPEQRQRKLTFVKFFPQLDWFIGSAEFLGDSRANFQQEILAQMESQIFGNQGYFFAGTLDGRSLLDPPGTKMTGVTNTQGEPILPELLRVVQSGGDFVEYLLPSLSGHDQARELGYVVGLLDWQWYVGVGVNLDVMEAILTQKRAVLWADLRQRGILLGITVFVLLGVQYFLAKWAQKRTTRKLQGFMDEFKAAESQGELMDPQAQGYSELHALALSANTIIQARVQAEEALRISEARYRRLVTNSHDLIFLLDDQGRILDANQRACDVLGYDFQTLTSLAAPDITLNVEPAMIQASLEQLRTEHSAIFYDTTVRKDGSTFPTELHLALFEENGRELFLGIARDITERERAEEKLRQSEAKFMQLFQFLPVPIVVLDLASERVVEANAACSAFFGLPYEEMLGRTTAELGLYKNPARRADLFQELRAQGSFYNQRAQMWDANKIACTCLVSSTIVVMDNKDRCLTSYQDITEWEKMQESMVQTEKMVSVGTMAAGVAHEINNPLAIIVQMAQNLQLRTQTDFPKNQAVAKAIGLDLVLLERYMTERGLHVFIEEIRAAGMRAAAIVRHMLDFTRKSTAHHGRGQYNIRSIVNNALALFRSDHVLRQNFDFSQIEINVCQDGEIPQILCTETEIEQVILNLLRNAAQAMAAKQTQEPRISIHLARTKQGVRITVADNGPGISPEIQRHIFEPFYTTKAPGEGTGLGLSVSYFIITQGHGGTVFVESEPGQGTSFSIELPIQPRDKETV